jgi:hypothetical protein
MALQKLQVYVDFGEAEAGVVGAVTLLLPAEESASPNHSEHSDCTRHEQQERWRIRV